MRLLIGAAAAAFLMAAPAVAQTPAAPALTSTCGEYPPQPTLPDGASANRAAMERGVEAYNTWITAAQAVQNCRNAEMTAWRTAYEGIGARNEADVQSANALNATWRADLEEFEARQNRGNRRGGGDPSQNRPQTQ